MSFKSEVAVVGSINLDISVPVPHLPAPGETILGGDALWSPGGKGANQAVAVARLGRRVSMVGCVGDDSAGADLVAGLEQDSIDTSGITVLAGVPTGLAMIAVDDGGENNIVVSPGANGRLSTEHIDALLADGNGLGDASLIMAQFEVPIETLSYVAERCPGRLILNPGPALANPTNTERKHLDLLLAASDVLVPNQGELATLVGLDVAETVDEVADQARIAIVAGATSVVVTLGGQGALVVESSGVTHIPILKVETLDTTGAGDSFCGGLVDALAGGETLKDAATWAARCASVTVTRRGAQDSLPTRADVLA